MPSSTVIAVIAFTAASSFVLLLYVLWTGRRTRLDLRVAELAGKTESIQLDPMREFAKSALPRMGMPLVPRDEEDRTQLQTRLIHAGLYSKQALYVFLGVKMLLILGPLFLGILVGILQIVPLGYALIGGSFMGVFGMIAPSFWLDQQKARRQTALRRSLPDALDVLVICLEGGLSFAGGLRRVASELLTAHPTLARELNIAQREIQLGWSAGDAVRRFANRTDLEEVRSLASVIAQSERYGASLVKALRVHAETLRIKRMQRAEEMAQKAAIKVIFPTAFCIFPAIILVLVGPAMFHFMALFARLSGR